LLLVTDPAWPDETILATVDAVASALAPGSFGVQLRDKEREIVPLRLFASRLRVLTRAKNASLFINGDAMLARDIGADGVHLGGDAMSIAEARRICGASGWVSISAHTDHAVRTAVEEGADAALVSPIFPTRSPYAIRESGTRRPTSAPASTKVPRGIDALRSARALADDRVLIYALGGVTHHNARACIDAGAHGIALIRGLLGSADPAWIARAIHDVFRAAW
jgi:thiamine-phosphate pyrophosphorylase